MHRADAPISRGTADLCKSIFKGDSNTLFGNGYTCDINSASTSIIVKLGSEPELRHGDELTVMANTIEPLHAPRDGSAVITNNLEMNVAVRALEGMPCVICADSSKNIIVETPEKFQSSCGDPQAKFIATITASGSAGREMQYLWDIKANPAYDKGDPLLKYSDAFANQFKKNFPSTAGSEVHITREELKLNVIDALDFLAVDDAAAKALAELNEIDILIVGTVINFVGETASYERVFTLVISANTVFPVVSAHGTSRPQLEYAEDKELKIAREVHPVSPGCDIQGADTTYPGVSVIWFYGDKPVDTIPEWVDQGVSTNGNSLMIPAFVLDANSTWKIVAEVSYKQSDLNAAFGLSAPTVGVVRTTFDLHVLPRQHPVTILRSPQTVSATCGWSMDARSSYDPSSEQWVEEKFGEQNFRVLSEMRREIFVYRP